MSDLHERFGNEPATSQQNQLMQELQKHIHNFDEVEPVDPNFIETLDLLLEEVKAEHPQAAGVVRQIMEILNNMGI